MKWAALLVLFTLSCAMNDKTVIVRLHVVSRMQVDMPSLSGIEKWKGNYFLAGDDSPWIFEMNSDLVLVAEHLVADPTNAVQGRIPKMQKPDYEAMTIMEVDGKHELWLLGSGSRSGVRDSLCRMAGNGDTTIQDFGEVYRMIRRQNGISEADFNIEAIQVAEDHLYIFNRGTGHVFRFSTAQMREFALKGNVPDTCEVFLVGLPAIGSGQAGFSGACWSDSWKMMIFSASAEHTSNWIDDGEVSGSLIGTWNPRTQEVSCMLVQDANGILPVKIESLCIEEEDSQTLRLIAVTDSDGGRSEIIRLDVYRE